MKRTYKDCLTNEMLRHKSKSQFDLVLHAIRIAEEMIDAGRESGRYPDQNLAFEILADIASGKEAPTETAKC